MKVYDLGSTVQYDNPKWNGNGFVEKEPNALWVKMPAILKNIALEEIQNGNKAISILENKDSDIVLLSFERGPLITRESNEKLHFHTIHEYGNYCYDGTNMTIEDVESGCFLTFENPESDRHSKSKRAINRPLTPKEKVLLSWLINNANPSLENRNIDLNTITVSSLCDCGCASIDFAINGEPLDQSKGINIVADYSYRSDKNNLMGCFLFTVADQLAGIEVWSIDGNETPTDLPSSKQLSKFYTA